MDVYLEEPEEVCLDEAPDGAADEEHDQEDGDVGPDYQLAYILHSYWHCFQHMMFGTYYMVTQK